MKCNANHVHITINSPAASCWLTKKKKIKTIQSFESVDVLEFQQVKNVDMKKR